MTAKLELFYQSYCPFCQLVLRKIDQLELGEYITLVDTTVSENFERHQQKTGRSTVPCLYIDGEPMFESSIIIKWLEDKQQEIKG